MNLNKVHLIGRLTKDPELRTLPSGSKVAEFGLATNYNYKKEDGTKVEKVSFHNIVAFGKPAEIISQYSKKGAELYVEGRIEYESWDKKDGSGKTYMTKIMVENFQLGAKPQGTSSYNKPEAKEDAPSAEESAPQNNSGEITTEEVPF